MNLAEVLAEDRRLAILRTLEEAPGSQLNEGTVHHAVSYLGHKVAQDVVRADLGWLQQHNLLRIEKLQVPSGELWLAKLSGAGADVARGLSQHPGVARPDPA